MSQDDTHSEPYGASADDTYNSSHRAMLQAFLSRSIMSVDELKPVLAAALTAHDPDRPTLEADITQPDITSFIQMINSRVSALDYEIRSTRDQASKVLVYALVNTTSDAMTQLATTFTADEIAYVKRILDAMFETNNTRKREIMAVSTMEASQLAKAPRRQSQMHHGDDDEDQGTQRVEAQANTIKLADAERVLEQLEAQKFLQKSRAGYWSLAPRGLLELRSYLKETYNEAPAEDDDDDDDDDDDIEGVVRIRDCEGCREIVTVGLRCSNRGCGVRWHDACAIQYFRAQRGEGARRCPKCKTEWAGDVYVGERAASAPRRNGASMGRSTQGRIEEDDEDDGDDGDE